MIYITGDTHGEFKRIMDFCDKIQPTEDDVMIILGDAGINFSGYPRDGWKKQLLAKLPLKIFCIHGNHEKRPETISRYKTTTWHGGNVWYEYEYPNILFAKDGEIYDFDGKKCIAIGGAYSVDKWYRLQMGYPWFPDEQPSDAIKEYVESQLTKNQWKVDVVLSHTLPYEYMPVDLFLSGIDQSKVDNSTEHWLSDIERKLDYKWWYAGHYHTSRITDKIQIMFEDIEEFGIHGQLREQKKIECLQSVGLDGYEDFYEELQSKVEKDYPIDHLYLIQLFDYNCPSCTSGVTKVFVEDIEDFSNHYQRIEKDQKRIERFLKSKSGEIITDYYSDDPELNIVQKVDVQDMGWKMAWKRDIKLSIPNGYDWESDYFFKLLALEIRYMKYKDNYYKLVKPIARDCCTDSMFDDERPYRKISIYGNPFWIYEEKSEIPRALVSLEEAQGITLESYVWQVADIFDTEEELKEDEKNVWPTDEQMNRIFADIPGDAG